MADLKSRLQAEIFERKNAELEGVNDKLRTENEVRTYLKVRACLACISHGMEE